MRKRLIALILTILLFPAFLPNAAFAVLPACPETDSAELVCNSDTEAALDGVCWLVDSMHGNCLAVSRLTNPAPCCACTGELDVELTALTDWPVDQLLLWEGRLLVSTGERLLTLDPDTAEVLEELRWDTAIDRFARSPEGLWLLSGGELRFLADGSGQCETVLSGVTSFWLEAPGQLSYMRDEETIHTMDLRSGLVTDRPNLASDLGDVSLWQGENEALGMGCASLKEKFPHGKYWNHMPQRGTGMSYNNQDGWTELPCLKHNNYCGTYLQTCNGYAPNGKELSYQCWGFADKLGYDASGRDPQDLSQEDGWKKLWVKSSLDSLKAGDIIRFNKNGSSAYAHSIYVTAVSGDTITYADCNYDGTCVIRWDQTIAKSTVKRWFVFLLRAPTPLTIEPTCLLSVNACLDGSPTDTLSDAVCFDVWRNGSAYKTGVSQFREYLVKGSTYEIRGVTPAEGILFDETAAALSGTLTEDKTITLTLDHYYLDSAGKAVKTTLTDLPSPDDWAYRAVCWALENGLAKGVTETEFRPNESCSRAQVVTFLWAAAGKPEASASELPFRDVPADSYFRRPLLWAAERGIAAGKSGGCFAPEELCSRAEVITFLWSAAGKPEPSLPEDGVSPFADVAEDAYYYRAVLWAVEHGVTRGTSAGRFSPNETCTRAQILTFLYAANNR